jgi:translocation protein SEC62
MAGATMNAMTGQPAPATATTSSAAPQINTSTPQQRNLAPRIEEVFDED